MGTVQLAGKFNNLLRQNTTYRINDVTVETKQSAIKKPDGTYHPLRPQTFAVLLYFCENSGRTVSKDELLTNLWDKADVSNDSLVQCIVEIRRALGKKSSKNLRTITRKGYVLKAESVKKVTAKPDKVLNAALVINSFTSADSPEQKEKASALYDSLITKLAQPKNTFILLLSSAPDHQQLASVYHLHASLHTKKQKTRVTVYLKDGNHSQIVWAETYEEKTIDSFDIQDKLGKTIADDVIQQLKFFQGLPDQQ